MRLYTHTHTSVLKNRKKERQEEVENRNVVDSLIEENAKINNRTSMSTNYVKNTVNKENCIKNVERTSNKTEKKEQTKKIKSKEGKLQKVSCLLVMRKIAAIVILMIIVIAILVCFGIKYNWQIENIIEEIGKVINIKGTSAEIEEVAAMDMTKVDLVPDKNGVNVPVPKGYVLSGASDENDVTKGAVIYEGTTAVTDANVATQKTTRNQFVWVPVSAANVSRLYTEDSYGRKSGKIYNYAYKTGERTLYTSMWAKEPALMKTDNEKNLQLYQMSEYTANKLYKEMQINFDETIESIKIYGGYYIGRYETGNLSKREPVCVQYNTDISNQTWYTMYSKAQYIAGNSNVKSAMIYRCLFDETLMWLVESGAKTQYEVGGDSTDWSNQRNSSFYYYATATASNTVYINSYPGERIPTGAKAGSNSNNWKRNCANNIYDLAGNVWDWSQCWYDYTEDEGKRVYCGGVCSLGLAAGTNAINFYESPEVKSDEVGCRVFLIIV